MPCVKYEFCYCKSYKLKVWHDFMVVFLIQMHAGLWPKCVWFLEITFMWICMCVCVHLRIISGVIWA